jgi:CDP-paratose 2-epimerase
VKILITGICGFVGSEIARGLKASMPEVRIWGIDNFSRAGSRLNELPLRSLGIEITEGDIRKPADLARIPAVDWVIDAAANPSVLAGVDGSTSSFELLDHNLIGTIRLLEFCKEHHAGFLLLSTSRVYSIGPLAALSVVSEKGAFVPCTNLLSGFGELGIREDFSTTPPLSLYGTSKKTSELLALEYGAAFDFPVWINRCGVMAGAGQFGKADQGIFSFWIHRWAGGKPLRYIGFGGHGWQVRDCLHPRDLVTLLVRQMETPSCAAPRIVNLSGGLSSATSLAQLSAWCVERFGSRKVDAEETPRPFDLPWVVLDSTFAEQSWGWKPETSVRQIFEEIALHALSNPRWLDVTGG